MIPLAWYIPYNLISLIFRQEDDDVDTVEDVEVADGDGEDMLLDGVDMVELDEIADLDDALTSGHDPDLDYFAAEVKVCVLYNVVRHYLNDT